MNYNFDLDPHLEDLRNGDSYWKSVIEKDNFEVGILRLGPGENDDQNPHKSDEIYYITKGNGFLTIDGKDHHIKKNSAYYVPKNTKHKFHGNTEEIVAFYVLN